MADKCWVLLNDNGGTNNDLWGMYYPQFGPNGALGTSNSGPRYSDSTMNIPIPGILPVNKFNFVYGSSTNANDFNCVESGYTQAQSRLWAYDVADNKAYYVGSLPTEGSDIGMGNSTFITGCEYGLATRKKLNGGGSQSCGEPNTSCVYTNLTLNQYSYNFSDPSSGTSFSRIALKTYRVVADGTGGQLIGIGNSATVANTGVPSYGATLNKSLLGTDYLGGQGGLGNAIGYISDTEVLVDDKAGNIWYVKLDNFYMGSSVKSSENPNLGLGQTSHPNNPGQATQLPTPAIGAYPGPGHPHTLENGWAVCSQLTNNEVYTVIGKKVIDLNWPHFQTGGNLNPVRTQGDLTFIANDESEGNQPTVAITISNSTNTTLMPSGKSVIKYPIDLNTFVVSTTPFPQQPANPTPPASQVGNQTTTAGSVAIVKEPTTDNYYLIASRKRYLAAISNKAQDTMGSWYSPLNVDITGNYLDYSFWVDTSSPTELSGDFEAPNAVPGQLPSATANDGSTICTTNIQQLNFRGGSQPPDCVFPSSYTYDCTINGCESVYSSSTIPAGEFLTLEACTGECRSYSCLTVDYTCTEIPGTGATNTYLVSDDCDEFCIPPYYDCGDDGCTQATVASHQYTSLNDCETACVSHNCNSNGCYAQNGTGGTFTDFATCTASCFSYVCGDDGAGNPTCTLFNPPFYGTGGTFTAATLVAAYNACSAATATSVCTSWSCNNEGMVASNTDIYVYYDSTSMSFGNTKIAHNTIMDWSATIPDWTGNIYHINMSDERWVSWAGIPYQQPTPRGLKNYTPVSLNNNGAGYSSSSCPGANCCPRSFQVTAWGQSGISGYGNGANWYDGWDPAIGNIYISSGSLAGTYQFRGYPPYAGGSFVSPDYSIPVLNVLFTDESDSPKNNAATGGNEFGNTEIYYDANRTSPGPAEPTWAATHPNVQEPTPPFVNDYNYWIGIWNTISINSGSVANFVYPTKPTNYFSWGSGTRMVFKHQALSVLAAISSGNMNNYIDGSTGLPYPQDGLWSAGTAPRMSSAGGASGSVPGICSIANLTQLETSNVYWDSGFGGLDQYGFGCNVEFPVINYALVQNDLEGFLTGGASILATGCTSAATSTNINYPYTSQTECLDFCDPKWECTDTGCILNSTGGTFDSYSACTGGTVMMVGGIMTDVPGCRSWSCSTVGCEIYNSPLGGTGGTYERLTDCNDVCTSWQCDYVPSNLMWTTDGCVEYVGTGQTYSAESACTASCISWDCNTNPVSPCSEYPNTAHTHNNEAACLASNNCGGWFQCQLAGCIAQPGAFVFGANNYATEQECKDFCVGWGCDQSSIANDTNIYVFYDTSLIDLPTNQNIYNAVMAWVNAIPGYTGNTYHTAIDDERWLNWGRAVFTGSTSLILESGLQTPSLTHNFNTCQLIQWGATTAQAAYWYDNQVPGTTNIPGLGSVTSKGTPPVASVTGNTLILCFLDESDGVTYINNGTGRYHNDEGVVNAVPVFSGGTVTAEYQPTTAWNTDYGLWTTAYQTILGSSGSTLGFVYPVDSTGGGVPGWGTLATATFALQVTASITEGDQPVKDGTFSASTYPRMTSAGGISGGVPPLCGLGNLQTLSYTNPYYSGGTGNLQAKGWGYNIEFAPFTSQGFQSDLGRFLAQNNNSVSAGGGCTSAETLWNSSITYPYSCETCTTANPNCCDCNCTPTQQLYECTYTGCALSSVGTLTWDQCNDPNYEYSCKSWSCSTDNGCLNYNYPNPQMLVHNGLTSAPVGTPYPNPLGGTGGTFTQLGECYRLCSSFNCVWDPINMSLNQNGCLQQIGTGGTYYNILQQTLGTDASYSACTGECQSYECNNPCGTVNYPIPVPIGTPAPPLNPVPGCTQYPNTGATHLTEIACTASCEEHWYCYTGAGQTFNANCLNATTTGIANVSFEGQISAIANNSTWQTTQFGNLRWDMTGNAYSPSPAVPATQLPLPPNPCVAPVGHWARIKSVSLFVNFLTPYYTWSTFIDACNTLGYVNPPLPYSSTWQDVINSVGPHIHCDWEWCQCETEPCKIGCIDELPLPSFTHGSYTSSTATTEVCCTGATATTWSCQTTTEANTCDGLTLIPGIYNTTLDAYNYMSINLGTNTFSGYHYESNIPPINTTLCSGPSNGGQLFKLTGITLTNSGIQTNNYTSWATFITALSSIPAPDGPILGLTVGMPAATIETQIQTYSAFCSSYIQYGITECICSNTPCNCVELVDGTGPYTSQTHCQEVCCNSGTSWNCQNGISYQPNCLTKDYVGMYNTDMNALDYFRINSATTQFGLSKVALATPNIAGINPLSWSQVQTAMGTAWNWMDCYYQLPGSSSFFPYKYVANIHHPAINGGLKYNTWQSFSGAVTTAGVTFNSTDTVATVCSKIGNQLGGATACKTEVFNCCRDESCYCYELFAPGGTYTNEPDCLTVCCPPPPMGWDCTPPQPPATIGVCNYVPYGPSPTWQDCILNCTGDTSWNCVPGIEQVAGVDSTNCNAGKIEMNPGVAMDGNQAIFWAKDNHPTTPIDNLYWLFNSSFGVGPNHCVDPVTGYFYRFSPKLGYTCPGGIYDEMVWWSFTITTWFDYIDYLNTTYQSSGNGSQPTTTPFYLGMTEQAILQMMRDTDPGWGTTWEIPGGCVRQISVMQGTCECIVTPCDCIEVPGTTGQYPTYALCIPPCCQVVTDTYDCTINGCVDPGGGYGQFQGASALLDCEDVCWEWACNNQNISSNCVNLIVLEFFGNLQYLYGALGLTNILPRTDVSSPVGYLQWAQQNQPGNVLIDFFGNPISLSAPYDIHYNNVTGVYNMQLQNISNYKMDTTIIGPESVLTGPNINNYCTSPNGRWWRPTGMGVVDRTSGVVLVPPQNSWYGLIKLLVMTYPAVCTQMGFPAGTPNPQPCIEDMLGVQPHEINFSLLGTPLGFGTLNGEFRLYGEGCVC